MASSLAESSFSTPSARHHAWDTQRTQNSCNRLFILEFSYSLLNYFFLNSSSISMYFFKISFSILNVTVDALACHFHRRILDHDRRYIVYQLADQTDKFHLHDIISSRFQPVIYF